MKFLVALVAILLVGLGWWYWDSHRTPTSQTDRAVGETPADESRVHEYSLTASAQDGFSIKEIRAKQGELIRLKVTGSADLPSFHLDALGIILETPAGAEMATSFVADLPGTYEYVAGKPEEAKESTPRGQLIVE